MTNAVFLNDGTPGRYQTGELTPIGQGAVGVVIPLLFLNFANRPVNISGYTITANMENVSNGDVTAVDGALAVTSGTAGAATWTVTANDTGTDAAFDVVFTLTKSANPTYVSSPTRLLVSDNPSVTASATNLLVGILQSLKDWLTAEKLATETAADGEILQSDGDNSEGSGIQSADVALKTGATFSGAITFSGTGHAGIRLNNLTTAQQEALVAANGMIIYNTSTGQFEGYDSGWGPIGGGAWGSITGTLSDQTDLQTALDAKLNEAADIVAVASSRDIAASDGGKILEVTATAALNCPNGLDSGLQCAIVSIGGTTTITAATTLQYLDSGVQTAASGITVNTQCTLYHRGSNVWLALGDVTAI